MFHIKVPYNIHDPKLGLKFDPNLEMTPDFADEPLERTQALYDEAKKTSCCQTLKKLISKNSKSFTTPEKDYWHNIRPKVDHQGSKKRFRAFKWIGPYVIEKVIPNDN